MRTSVVVLAAAVVASAAGCSGERSGASAPVRSSAPTAVVAGEQLTCLVGTPTRCWGENPFLDGSGAGQPLEVAPTVAVLAIGRHHACRLEDGRVACWGSNLDGQLGGAAAAATCVDRPCAREPEPVPGLPRVASVAAGGFHTCAVAADGTVWCWGSNATGQLGRAAAADRSPAPVQGLADVTAIAAGLLHTCAVDASGDVACWGNADGYRLGIDTDDPTITAPARVPDLGGAAVAVAAGAEHTCALLADGTVRCWGGNRFGQLGDGTTRSRARPAPVSGLGGRAVEIAAGDHFTCARLEDGSVACWGWNDHGQIGVGSFDGPAEPDGFSCALVPARVVDLPGPALSVAAGAGHACALVGDRAWCWGRNEAGQLGDGTRVDRPAPVEVGRPGAPAPPPAATAAVATGSGLDVSYHSGRIDWPVVIGQGHEFAFTLSTAGDDFADPLFSSHWTRMASVRRGAYHFFVAADDPSAQARWFISNTPLGPGDLAPVVDVETLGDDPPDDLARRLRAFVAIVERHYGVRPIVYTGPRFWDRYLGDGYGDHALWIAEYGVTSPTVPTGWSSWTIWQHRGNASIPGVERVVDLNRLAGGDRLDALVIPAS